MVRYILAAVLLSAAVCLYCMGQKNYAAFLVLGWACEMAAIAIGTRAARTSPPVAVSYHDKNRQH